MSFRRRNRFLWLIIIVFCLFKASLASRTVLFDNFSDGSLINPPETINNPIWETAYSFWLVPTPVDDGSGNMVLTKPCGIYAGDSEWTDYEVEVKFKLTEGGDNLLRLVINVRYDEANTQNFYQSRIMFAPQNPEWTMAWQCIDNESGKIFFSTSIGPTPLEQFGNTWHTFTTRIVGNYMLGFIDGIQIGSEPIKLTGGHEKGKIFMYSDKLASYSGDWIYIDHIKVTDLRPVVSANPQVIAADGEMESIINVNWIANGRVRVTGPSFTMSNLDGEPVDNIVLSPTGEGEFKVKGFVAGQFPLEVSLNGTDWWVPLPDQRAIKMVSVVDPVGSSIYIPNLEDGQRFPAAGEGYPVAVKVNIVDYDGENIGESGRHKVSLVKTDGGPGIISSPQIIDGDGELSFSLTSIESGTVTLEAQGVPVDENGNPVPGIKPVKLKNKITLTLDQAISPTNSTIEIIDNGPVSADGVNKQKVKALLRDYKNNVIGGRGVTFTPQSFQEQVTVLSDEEITTEDGIAFFEIVAISSQKIAVPFLLKGRLTTEDGAQLFDVKPFDINFESPIKVGTGENESKIILERMLVAPIDAYPELSWNAVPADGASSWKVNIKLFDQNGDPAVGRQVSLSAGEGELLDGDIKLERQQALTDSSGVVNYRISTQQTLVSPLTVNLQLDIKNDRSTIQHILIFAPDNFKPVVVSTVPQNGENNAEVSAPIVIIFNETIKPTSQTKIKLLVDKNGEAIEEAYSGNETNWTFLASEHKVIWRHKRFRPNVQYQVIISDISDMQGNIMESYSWAFSAQDSQPPHVLVDGNGILLTSPRPGEPEISTEINVVMPFNEPLFIDESGKPVGLKVGLYKEGILVKEIIKDGFEYIEQNGEIKVEFPLEGLLTDSTYALVVKKARDLADLEMEETQWSFNTVDTMPSEVISYNPKGQINEDDFYRIIEIRFSDDVAVDSGQISLIHNGMTYELETLSYDSESFTWRLKPVEDLWMFDESYKIEIEGIKKRINNPYGDVIIKNSLPRFNWTFVVASGSPEVIEFSVQGGKEEAELNTSLGVVFDRFIKMASTPNIYIVNQDTQDRLEISWSYLEEYGNLAKGVIINPNQDNVWEFNSGYFLEIEGISSESGKPANISLAFQTKVEVTESVLVKADGTDKQISLEFSDNTEVALIIPGNALLTDTEFYASSVRKNHIKAMATKIYQDQGIVSAFEISIIPNDNFAAPITIKFPFVEESGEFIKATDNLGNEILLPFEQLFISRWRSWETPDGKGLGEWIPIESNIDCNNNQIFFETDNTGIFAILGYKNIKEVELLGEVKFTQNPVMPGQSGKRSATSLKFYLQEPAIVTLNVFDRNGRFITTLVERVPLGEGYQGLSWDGMVGGISISSGIYIVQLRVKSDKKTMIHHEILSVW